MTLTTSANTSSVSIYLRARAAGGWISGHLAAERERWPLWLPVGFGLGIAIYLGLKTEPSPLIGVCLLVGGLVSAIVARRYSNPASLVLAPTSVVVLTIAAGFAAIQARSNLVAAPILGQNLSYADVAGTVVQSESLSRAHRFVLADVAISGIPLDETPARIRIRVAGETGAHIRAGDRLTFNARLLPPPGPAAPGAFDFQRRAWFDRIGAVGFSFGAPTVHESSQPPTASQRAATTLALLRGSITERVLAILPGTTGAIAAALITGERGAIPPHVLAAVRAAGLAHLLAISGLHIGLVAGFVFLLVRGGLALVPSIALHWPLKKIAAGLALLAALFYMFLAGASVPTQRAVVMTGIVLLAVLTDRTAISMRLVAWAAALVLLIRPEALIGASFQMSFAAVVALVAVYEAIGRRVRVGYGRRSMFGRLTVYLAGVALTTIIATTATAPFVLFHFNQLAAYGLLANLIAVPLTAAWVMPFGVLALVGMPLGLDTIFLQPMGWGIDIIVTVAQTIATWPGAVQRFPTIPAWGLASATFGGLWFCLMQQRWRYAGALGIAAAIISMTTVRVPDVLVERDGNLVALRAPDATYWFSSLRREEFTREIWLRRAGVANYQSFPENGATTADQIACDTLGCMSQIAGKKVAVVFDPAALADDCMAADIVVAPRLFLPAACDQPIARVDRRALLRDGAHAITIIGGSIRLSSANEIRGRRPWVPKSDR